MEHKPENNSGPKDRIALWGFLFASVCFYAAAALAVIRKDGSDWTTSFCLGSAFLCLSQTHWKSGKSENDSKKEISKSTFCTQIHTPGGGFLCPVFVWSPIFD